MNNVPRRYRTIWMVALALLAVAFSPIVTSRARADATAASASHPITAASAAPRVQGVGSQQPGIAYESSASLGADLDAMRAAGMTWVRADFFWSTIQAYGPTSWNWGPTDAFVRAANARHLHVLAILAYTPAWARSGGTQDNPPRDPNTYANFARAAARRYAPMGVHAWEIWNEPNLSLFWSPRADPAAYANLLRHAYPAIKSADAHATVITGGLSPSTNTTSDQSPLSFLAAMYSHGAKGYFDALGLHPYSYPYAPMYQASWNTFFMTPWLHILMAAHGDGGKLIWGTEVGYPTGTSSQAVSEQRQADNLVAAITSWRKWSFTGPLFIFRLRDTSTNASSTEDNMGLLQYGRQPKPAYTAVRRKLG